MTYNPCSVIFAELATS